MFKIGYYECVTSVQTVSQFAMDKNLTFCLYNKFCKIVFKIGYYEC